MSLTLLLVSSQTDGRFVTIAFPWQDPLHSNSGLCDVPPTCPSGTKAPTALASSENVHCWRLTKHPSLGTALSRSELTHPRWCPLPEETLPYEATKTWTLSLNWEQLWRAISAPELSAEWAEVSAVQFLPLPSPASLSFSQMPFPRAKRNQYHLLLRVCFKKLNLRQPHPQLDPFPKDVGTFCGRCNVFRVSLLKNMWTSLLPLTRTREGQSLLSRTVFKLLATLSILSSKILPFFFFFFWSPLKYVLNFRN